MTCGAVKYTSGSFGAGAGSALGAQEEKPTQLLITLGSLYVRY